MPGIQVARKRPECLSRCRMMKTRTTLSTRFRKGSPVSSSQPFRKGKVCTLPIFPCSVSSEPLNVVARSQRSRASSDDDFIDNSDALSMLEDSDIEGPQTSSRRNSSISSSNADFMDTESASELSDAPKKKSARPPLKKSQSSGANAGGNNSFLTAAEQRALGKKTEKKAGDDPFDFLKDVLDVSANCLFPLIIELIESSAER